MSMISSLCKDLSCCTCKLGLEHVALLSWCCDSAANLLQHVCRRSWMTTASGSSTQSSRPTSRSGCSPPATCARCGILESVCRRYIRFAPSAARSIATAAMAVSAVGRCTTLPGWNEMIHSERTQRQAAATRHLDDGRIGAGTGR